MTNQYPNNIFFILTNAYWILKMETTVPNGYLKICNKCWRSSPFFIQRGQIGCSKLWDGSFLWRVNEQLKFPNIIIQMRILTCPGVLHFHRALKTNLSKGIETTKCLERDFTVKSLKDSNTSNTEYDDEVDQSLLLANRLSIIWKLIISYSFNLGGKRETKIKYLHPKDQLQHNSNIILGTLF